MKKRLSIGLSMALLASSSLTAMAHDHEGQGKKRDSHKQIESVEFTSMKAPGTIENMVKTYTDATVKVTYKDGSVEEKPLNYNQLFLIKR